jgi:hypothetical protein
MAEGNKGPVGRHFYWCGINRVAGRWAAAAAAATGVVVRQASALFLLSERPTYQLFPSVVVS